MYYVELMKSDKIDFQIDANCCAKDHAKYKLIQNEKVKLGLSD